MNDCQIINPATSIAGYVLSRIHCCVPCLVFILATASGAEATQVHPPSEGVYVHQIAHLFFMFSMGILVYWLRDRKLVVEKGWRFVQYAAFFFILWNADAVIVHYLDGREDLFETINAGAWDGRVELHADSRGLGLLYYLAKMDHLLCLPAIIFLYLGLRELLKQAQKARSS